jgi:hypothetical protein
VRSRLLAATRRGIYYPRRQFILGNNLFSARARWPGHGEHLPNPSQWLLFSLFPSSDFPSQDQASAATSSICDFLQHNNKNHSSSFLLPKQPTPANKQAARSKLAFSHICSLPCKNSSTQIPCSSTPVLLSTPWGCRRRECKLRRCRCRRWAARQSSARTPAAVEAELAPGGRPKLACALARGAWAAAYHAKGTSNGGRCT